MARILLAGDEQALAAHEASRMGPPRPSDSVRLDASRGARVEDWSRGRLRAALGKAGARTDCVWMFLGCNHLGDARFPSVLPVLEQMRGSGATLLWIGPPRMPGGEEHRVVRWLESALAPHTQFFAASRRAMDLSPPAPAARLPRAIRAGRFASGLDAAPPSPSPQVPTLGAAAQLSRAVSLALPPDAPGKLVTADLSDAFFTKGQDMAGRLGLDFGQLLLVMNYESGGIRASAVNPRTQAVGLIQLMDPAVQVGFQGTRADFKALSAEEQLPYVERYLQPYASKHLSSAGRIWQAILGPATLDDASGLLYSATGTRWVKNGVAQEPIYYQANAQLDDPDLTKRKGAITVDDLTAALVRAGGTARCGEALRRWAALTGTPLPAPAGPGSPRAPADGSWVLPLGLAAVLATTLVLAGRTMTSPRPSLAGAGA